MPFGPGVPGMPGRPDSPLNPGEPGRPGRPFGPFANKYISVYKLKKANSLVDLVILEYLGIHDHLFRLVGQDMILNLVVLVDLRRNIITIDR